jgi:putative DNA primase/helicase
MTARLVSAAELQAIADGERHRSRTPEADSPPEFSDEALALTFADRHAEQLRYVASWAKWMVFDGAKWASDETRLAFSLARTVCREAAAECRADKTSLLLASAKTRAAVITLANDDRRLAATSEQWDADANAFNTPKGQTLQ